MIQNIWCLIFGHKWRKLGRLRSARICNRCNKQQTKQWTLKSREKEWI